VQRARRRRGRHEGAPRRKGKAAHLNQSDGSTDSQASFQTSEAKRSWSWLSRALAAIVE
jgi:hypothetical protein